MGRHVARIGDERCLHGGGDVKKRPLEDPGLDWRKILQWVFEKRDEEVCTGLSWLKVWADSRG